MDQNAVQNIVQKIKLNKKKEIKLIFYLIKLSSFSNQ